MPDMASGCPTIEQSMPCQASFFDAMFGVKKPTNFYAAITGPTSANEAQTILGFC